MTHHHNPDTSFFSQDGTHRAAGGGPRVTPSLALVRDLEVAIRRLGRRATVMNLSLLSGGPMILLDAMIQPVEEQATRVRALLAQATEEGVDINALQVQLNQLISDELAGILSDTFNPSGVPDHPGGLID